MSSRITVFRPEEHTLTCRDKCRTSRSSFTFSYCATIPGAYQCFYVRYSNLNYVLILGKGQRDELDHDEGIDIANKMRQVVERELRKANAKL